MKRQRPEHVGAQRVRDVEVAHAPVSRQVVRILTSAELLELKLPQKEPSSMQRDQV